jgi:hypothetical protein
VCRHPLIDPLTVAANTQQASVPSRTISLPCIGKIYLIH